MLKAVALSAETLASVLEQTVDCVKLIGLDGSIRWMNANGIASLECADFAGLKGTRWVDLWPQDGRKLVQAALDQALLGDTARFDGLCPTLNGTPRWWNITVSRVEDTDQEMAGFLAISRDITAAENNRLALEIAAAELRHRLKNTYTMVGSLLTGFARGTPDREAFAQEMLNRLVALSTAQALFSTQAAPCEIATLIPALVGPFAGHGCEIDVAPLPNTFVSQGQADAIALVLGELAVNSAKHGALAVGGALHLSAAEAPASLKVIWQERSEQPVRAHDRPEGQGLKLIERIVRARRGNLAIAWHDAGLTVTLEFSLDSGI